MKKTLGIVGARGYTGAELIALVAGHPAIELAFVSSRELDGQRVADQVAAFRGELRYEALDAAAVAARGVDAVVLALPNGKAAPYVEAIDAAKPDTVIVDLSADYRFDERWYYGLPELTRAAYRGQQRISNPGCYATAMQLAIAPLKDDLAAPPTCFGVSGYSGAGTTPSDKNDPDKLRDNLMPYALVGHVHEREVSQRLGLPVSVANSATLLRYPHAAQGWTRLGLMLYGASPFEDEDALSLGLRPVMTLETKLIAVRELAAGERVGYGGAFTATQSLRMGVAACGYADGYPRHAPSGSPVMVEGILTRTLGRVSMDLTILDVTGCDEAKPGAMVEFLGPNAPLDDVAQLAGTAAYEILTTLAGTVGKTGARA